MVFTTADEEGNSISSTCRESMSKLVNAAVTVKALVIFVIKCWSQQKLILGTVH